MTNDYFELGIVVTGVGLSQKALEPFMDTLYSHTVSFPFYLKVVMEKDYGDFNPDTYSQSKAKNIGIRECIRMQIPVIVCTDIDYLIPNGLTDFTVRETRASHLWVQRREVTTDEMHLLDWFGWMHRPVRTSCTGSWNSLSLNNWLRLGGWDERCFGWGGEDDILHRRIQRKGIPTRVSTVFPLMHIRHNPRAFCANGKRAQANLSFAHTPQQNYLKEALNA